MSWNPLSFGSARKEIPMPRLLDLSFVRLMAHRLQKSMARAAPCAGGPVGAPSHPLRTAHAVATCGLATHRPAASRVASKALGDGLRASASASVSGVRLRVDPSDRHRTLISGTMDEVCDALDSLIEEEARAQSRH